MSDLVRYQASVPVTREEALTRCFYQWERRGRGWNVYDFPVELEPALVPLFFAEDQPITDDGRQETFFSKLLAGSHQEQAIFDQRQRITEYKQYLAEMDEPDYCSYYGQEFTEHRLVFPIDFDISRTIAENLLLSFSYASAPISFEVIGTKPEVIIQIASSLEDRSDVSQQIRAHLPGCFVAETTGSLESAWLNGADESLIVDFGLSNEFILPLDVSGNHFESDILTTIVGALSNLEPGEVGILQVLFRKAKLNWHEEILYALQCIDAKEIAGQVRQKLDCQLFAAVVRVAAKARHPDRAMQIVRSVSAGLVPLASSANELIPLSNDEYACESSHEQGLLERASFRSGMILNIDELVSLVHPPTRKVVSDKLQRDSQRTKAAPSLLLNNRTILGENLHRGRSVNVSLSDEQRTKHVHLIGSSGSGKSSLLLNLIKQDLENAQGLCVIDPHGDLIDDVVGHIPNNRLKDVILFDPSDGEYPVGFNILQANSELEKNLLSSDLVAVFRRMATSWGDVMDSVLANAILAFVESSEGGTLFGLRRFLVEKAYRDEFLTTVSDYSVLYFWEREFTDLANKPQSSILIRLDGFLRNKLIRNIVCQKQTRLDFRKIMDQRKVLLIKLSQGLIGEENAHLLGTLLVSKLHQTALSRQDSANRPYFWVYIDEFQHFITPSMENILSGVRKYNIGLHLSHQGYRQLQSRNQDVASSVLSNCYTRICFRLGDSDSEKFAGGFSFFDAKALQNLGIGEAIARVERAEFDFNLRTTLLGKVESVTARSKLQAITRHTRENFARPMAEVEAELFSDLRRKEEKKEAAAPTVAGKNQSARGSSGGKEQTGDEERKISPKERTSPDGHESHRYLQTLLKRIGESHGFVATLEKQVFGGIGRIDVFLDSEHTQIACEIAITNAVKYELENVQKCLAAGFDKVVVISPDRKHLVSIKESCKALIAAEQFSKVHFLEPEHFHLFLEKLNAEVATPKEGKVKGYTVSVSIKEDAQDREVREQVIAEILENAMDRKR
ncbi:MAG: type IV secretion system DNA-binding domain-containing protein [Chloracidobacterium sp.]|nr:type IV secretion system DNA-binding domain-containing protein [Chloracidobacterium sp.]